MRTVGGNALFLVVRLSVFLGVAIGLQGCDGARLTAELSAIDNVVERFDGVRRQRESVPAGTQRKMYEGDGVTVNQGGCAKLKLGGCLLTIFRDTGLEWKEVRDEGAPACVFDFEHGTLRAQVEEQMILNTEWAVITTVATDFFVHLDPEREIIWVIVEDGVVQVEAAGQRIEVAADQQSWVQRGQPPVAPRSASRQEVGDRFPSLNELTNNLLSDDEWLPRGGPPSEDLAPEVRIRLDPDGLTPGRELLVAVDGWDDHGVESITILIDGQDVARCPGSPCEFKTEFAEPGLYVITARVDDTSGQRTQVGRHVEVVSQELSISLDQSTDEVIAGECAGPRTVQISATVQGLSDAVADVAGATLKYGWEGSEQDIVGMDRVDSQTFLAQIGPFDYCCEQTRIVYTVEVFDRFEAVVASGSGEVLLTYCIASSPGPLLS